MTCSRCEKFDDTSDLSIPYAATSDRKAAMSDIATFGARTDATATVRRRWRHVLRHSLTRPIYALYGRRLLAQVMLRPPPRHVGIILDGNRRFGRLSGVVDPLWSTRRRAEAGRRARLVRRTVDPRSDPVGVFDRQPGAPAARGVRDPGRGRGQVECSGRRPADPSAPGAGQAIGRLELLPESTVAAIRAAEAATADYDAMLLRSRSPTAAARRSPMPCARC